MTTQQVRVDGVDIAYTDTDTDTDTGSGPTILFVHGVYVTGALWNDVVSELDGGLPAGRPATFGGLQPRRLRAGSGHPHRGERLHGRCTEEPAPRPWAAGGRTIQDRRASDQLSDLAMFPGWARRPATHAQLP